MSATTVFTPCTVDSVKKLLVNVLESITGFGKGRVIIEGEAGPRPSDGLYCSLWWREGEPLPQNDGDFEDTSTPEDDDITQHLRNETWCTVQISFWGRGAFAKAMSTVSNLQSAQRWFDLWRLLGYGGVDKVQDLSAAFRGQVQGRAFFNLSFYACFGASYPADWFDSVTFETPREKIPLDIPGEQPICPDSNPNTEAKP